MALGIGDTLRDARRRQHRTLADAASQTRVRESHLAALEAEQFDALGGDVYVKGFLRSYARYLELDPEPLVDLYRRDHQGVGDLSALLASRPVERSRASRGTSSGIVAVVVGLVLLGLAVIGSRNPADQPLAAPSPQTTPSVAPAGAQVPAEPSSPSVLASPEPTAAAPTPTPVPFTAVEAVITVDGGANYLRIDEGAPDFEGELVDGERRMFAGNPALRLRVGNAGVVRLVVDGQDQGAIGRPGQVVDVSCTPGAMACTLEEVTP